MKNVIPLIVSLLMFALAFVAIRYPGKIREWARRQSPGIAPDSVRQSSEHAMPTIFAVFGILLGIVFLAAFILSVTGNMPAQ